MTLCFLLRFQEFCPDESADGLRAGTRTETRVRGEQGDADPARSSLAPIPRRLAPRLPESLPAGGRGPSTRREARLPVAQTKTVTAVRAEADDNDPRRAALDAIPRCS